MLRVGSLFAGVGGFDLAAERAGMKVVWQSEIDKYASEVLARWFPGVPNLGDIHAVGEVPEVDVLAGGFPCQDYSVAGNRAGLAGDRGALWWEYHRLITELRPTWVVGENVPGLLSSRGGTDFETLVGSLTECGYGVVWAVLDARHFGVAQRRRRVIIVGHSGGEPRPEVLAIPEGVFGHPAPGSGEGEDIAGTLEARPTDARGRVEEGHLIFSRHDHGGDVAEDVSPTLRAMNYDKSHVNGGGQVAVTAVHATQQPIHSQDEALPLGRLGYQGILEHAAEIVNRYVRRLTPLECERLQGFPDGWTEGCSDAQRYRQMGNAVAVPVAEWVMRRIAAA